MFGLHMDKLRCPRELTALLGMVLNPLVDTHSKLAWHFMRTTLRTASGRGPP